MIKKDTIQELLKINNELKIRIKELEDTLRITREEVDNEDLRKSQLAALNLMEDAQNSKLQAEKLNLELQKEIEERKNTEKALVWNSRRNELLSEIASKLLQSDAPRSLIKELCLQVMEFLECQVFFNYFVDAQEERLCRS